MYFVNTPYLLKKFYPGLIWEIPNNHHHVFLTFDDGPTPDITEEVLAVLSKNNAKATFFCTGKNVEKNPAIYQCILQEGHTVGNHSFMHQNGWKTNDIDYIEDVKRGSSLIHSNLFRPPYGKITFSQIEKLKIDFKIVMWSVLSADFDNTISPQQCLKNSIEQIKSGSIIVFHDSEKAKKNMLYTLPRFLEHCHAKNLIPTSLHTSSAVSI
ncbi:Peptidoglycan-N-acetylglucosamine deacetylase [Flavobacteriales bacterium]|nr:Peptidoglycan-N-acetylglucosamine deacetylase [Flavobacteriales bacterium]MCL4817109.1 polysaccharide deacetylase family protein [Flavobacteriales bacterium]WKZ75322.1 MAG: polysaccharide deacetylase family protein [Vicingaceae bacterium]GIK70724.1 MAG: polysaccharide deacetylase [Bacteroidota bacterium]CAG0993124.1 Peptidoglycan-N-acetylglucosamine deacetylase [Flavobacteriales bacterium]